MRSNFLKAPALVACLLLTAACESRHNDKANDEIIGQSLEAITSLRETSGTPTQTVALYDSVVKKIHQFDLNTMTVDRTIPVLNTGSKHYVLHSGSSNYMIDLSDKHISIFDQQSKAQHQPITFQGKPKSAAFRPDLGTLIVYDDLQSLGVIKLSPTGVVTDKHVFGSVVTGSYTITAGDLLDDGSLALALSDGSISLVDLSASMAAVPRRLIGANQVTGLPRITWLAPIQGIANRVLIRTESKIVLYDVVSNTVIQERIIAATEQVLKLSKNYNPHIVLSITTSSMQLVYTDGASLLFRDISLANRTDGYDSVSPILNSDLDLSTDTWTYVYVSAFAKYSAFNDVNQRKDKRMLVRVRVSDNLALKSIVVPDQAEIKLSYDYFFALFPSPLGLAEKYSIHSAEKLVMKNFNLKKY